MKWPRKEAMPAETERSQNLAVPVSAVLECLRKSALEAIVCLVVTITVIGEDIQ